MPTFGQQFLQGFLGGAGTLRDYTHASKTFTTNAYELKPRFKFLFHVKFTLNSNIPALNQIFTTDDNVSISYLVKTVDLPKFNISTETLNQYNRKRIVQNKIEYQPITITMHDDGGDVSRNLWYNYFAYYYKDSVQPYGNSTGTTLGPSNNQSSGQGVWPRDIYSDNRQVNDWGFIGESYSDGGQSASGKPPFFSDIRIYGMDQHKFAEYVLINPVITNFSHDQYNYSEGGGIMQNSMTIAYESVKYYSGAIGDSRPDNNVQGFADPAHYDQTKSALARPGSTSTVFGQGGLLDAGAGILEDLQNAQTGGPAALIGAAMKAGTVYNTFKGKNIASLAKGESVALGTQAIKSGIRNNNGRFFPTQQTPSNNQTPGQQQ